MFLENRKSKNHFFFAGNSSVTRNWKRGNTKTRASGAFIFLVYRPRGALDNVRFPRWKWLQYGRHPVDVDVWTRARHVRRSARANEAPLPNGWHKAPCVRWASRKKGRKKERKRGKGQLIGGNSSHWIETTWKKIPTELLRLLRCRSLED